MIAQAVGCRLAPGRKLKVAGSPHSQRATGSQMSQKKKRRGPSGELDVNPAVSGGTMVAVRLRGEGWQGGYTSHGRSPTYGCSAPHGTQPIATFLCSCPGNFF